MILGYLAGLIVMTLVAAIGQIVAAIVLGLLIGTGPGGSPQGENERTTLSCEPDHQIIRIYGTDSTGQFSPSEIVRSLDPAQPPAEIFAEAHQNPDFDTLLDGASGCLLTFSYDDTYLAHNSVPQRGVNAWNHSTSPWNVKPDKLADRLRDLIRDYPANVTFDIVAYSAGGIVPTYWAARDETTNAERARVHSIVVVDGIVSGVDLELLDLACVVPGLRQAEIATYGRLACQFRYAGPFTSAVRAASEVWRDRVTLATIRATGDLIVWHRFAGLPGKTVEGGDPAIIAKFCAPSEWFTGVGGFVECVRNTHGSVLVDGTAVETIAEVVGLPP